MAIEPQPDESGAKLVKAPIRKTHTALSRVQRALTDQELSTTGVQKMLVERISEAEERNKLLETYRDQFYSSEKQVAVLDAKLQRTRSAEILSSGCLAVGAILLGYTPSVWKAQPSGWFSLILGLILLTIGILAKAIRL